MRLSNVLIVSNFRNYKNSSTKQGVHGHVPLANIVFEAAHHTALYPTKTRRPAEQFSVVKNSTYPLPIYSRQFPYDSISDDPVRKLIKQKLKRDFDINYFKVRARREGRDKLFSAESISTDTIKLIRAMESDPDPHVQSHYDWHFYGGNLESMVIDEQDYLVQLSSREANDIKFLPVQEYQNKFTYDNEQLTDLPGHEIIKNKKRNSRIVLAARYKNDIRFLKRKHLKKEQFTKYIDWEEDITSGTFVNNQFCFVDVKKVISKFDLKLMERNASINLTKVDGNRKLPMTVGTTFDKNCILYTTRTSLGCIDFRSPLLSYTLFDSDNYLYKCEEISCQLKSSFDNLIYVASSHLLYGVDVRYSKKPVLSWTHQIIDQPSILKSVKHNEQEVICLASNIMGDLKIFNNRAGLADTWEINRIPFKPKNSLSTFNKCKDNGLFLFSDAITRHNTLNTAGITMVSQSKLHLYTQNSIGDIFQSELIEDDSNPTFLDKDIERFQEWDASLIEEKRVLEKKKFPITNYVNLRGITRILKHSKINDGPSQEDKVVAETSEFHIDIKPEWEVDIQQVKDCKDVLAATMLSIWDVDHNILSENPLDALNGKQDKTAVLFSVSQWLNSTTVNSTQLSEMSIDNIDNLTFGDMSQIQDTQPSQATISKPVRASQQTNKRVKGF